MTTTSETTEGRAPLRRWRHTRKGLIVGIVLHEDEEWITVQLAHTVDGYRTCWFEGQELTFRRAFATEVPKVAEVAS